MMEQITPVCNGCGLPAELRGIRPPVFNGISFHRGSVCQVAALGGAKGEKYDSVCTFRNNVRIENQAYASEFALLRILPRKICKSSIVDKNASTGVKERIKKTPWIREK